MSKPITAVVVTYQSEHTIVPALRALKRSYDEGLLSVVVVDNSSTDRTLELLKANGAWAKVIASKENNGFGRGCNLGFANVNSPYTIFINPDAVVEPDALRILYEFMERNPRVGIVGPAILEGDHLQITGDRPTPWSTIREVLPSVDSPINSLFIEPGSDSFQTGWVCGAVLMIRTELMKLLRGFDPRFFLYWEEMDLCKGAEDEGFEVWAVGNAITHHVGGASTSPEDMEVRGCIATHYYQSRYYYMVKHHGWFAATLTEIAEFLLLVAHSVVDAVRGRGWTQLRSRLQAPLLSMPDKK